jgi:hypothetical protein
VLKRRDVIILSIVAGMALEIGVHFLSGRREAWDSQQYWTIGLPAVGLLSAVIGACSRGGEWKWVALIVPSQTLTMMIRGGEIGSLWPLTVALSAILSAPFFFAAFIGSRFRSP